MLTLDKMNLFKAEINYSELKDARNEEPFNATAVELFKEVSQYTSILGSLYKLDTNNEPRLWSRDEAVLGGLMIRISKLLIGYLDAVCDRHMEIANILARSIAETTINLKYLIKFYSDELIDQYISYSLRSEKELYEQIEQNIHERGYELPIESRMKESIYHTFKISDKKLDDVDSSNRTHWAGSIYSRFKALKMENTYLGIFGIQSHFVHGNWQELVFHHLIYKDGLFEPKPDWARVHPQVMLAMGIFVIEVAKDYLNIFTIDSEDKSNIMKLLDECYQNLFKVDGYHERFLSQHS